MIYLLASFWFLTILLFLIGYIIVARGEYFRHNNRDPIQAVQLPRKQKAIVTKTDLETAEAITQQLMDLA